MIRQLGNGLSRGPQDQSAISFRLSSSDKTAYGRMIGYGVVQGLIDPDFQIAGGNVLVKRAIYNIIDQGGVDATNFDANALLGNIASAQSYERYLANQSVVNALVSAEPESVLAAETLLTLARATADAFAHQPKALSMRII